MTSLLASLLARPPPHQFLAQGYKVGRVDQCETALGAELRVRTEGQGTGRQDDRAPRAQERAH
jgi:hypothetical protein